MDDSLMILADAGQPQGQASTSSSMTATDAVRTLTATDVGAPQGQAGTISKKQAVMGPSRDKYDQLREQLAQWKTTSAEEKKRREQAEADAVLAREDAQEGAKLELHSYIQEYEKDCANHYAKEAADLRQQLQALQGHSMGVLNDLNQEKQRAAEAMQTLANEQAAHERNMADKTSEVLALMSRLRATRSHAPAVNQPPFPVSQPAMRPEFCSPATREQRSIECMIRTSNDRILVILQARFGLAWHEAAPYFFEIFNLAGAVPFFSFLTLLGSLSFLSGRSPVPALRARDVFAAGWEREEREQVDLGEELLVEDGRCEMRENYEKSVERFTTRISLYQNFAIQNAYLGRNNGKYFFGVSADHTGTPYCQILVKMITEGVNSDGSPVRWGTANTHDPTKHSSRDFPATHSHLRQDLFPTNDTPRLFGSLQPGREKEILEIGTQIGLEIGYLKHRPIDDVRKTLDIPGPVYERLTH
ncbi:hypothetical protein B0H14DRAFT_2591412 [Mycena olivaceomarginata]|nr:hypothetical protein B0H14DRAFT_2591412 [Mycena olivaceomarginata]